MRVIKTDELANGVEFAKRHLIADTDYLRGYVAALDAIVALSEQYSIEAEPVRYGRWIYDTDGLEYWCDCDQCGHREWGRTAKDAGKHCRECGAKMDAGLQDLEELEMTV